jgi:hypothetical protein
MNRLNMNRSLFCPFCGGDHVGLSSTANRAYTIAYTNDFSATRISSEDRNVCQSCGWKWLPGTDGRPSVWGFKAVFWTAVFIVLFGCSLFFCMIVPLDQDWSSVGLVMFGGFAALCAGVIIYMGLVEDSKRKKWENRPMADFDYEQEIMRVRSNYQEYKDRPIPPAYNWDETSQMKFPRLRR